MCGPGWPALPRRPARGASTSLGRLDPRITGACVGAGVITFMWSPTATAATRCRISAWCACARRTRRCSTSPTSGATPPAGRTRPPPPTREGGSASARSTAAARDTRAMWWVRCRRRARGRLCSQPSVPTGPRPGLGRLPVLCAAPCNAAHWLASGSRCGWRSERLEPRYVRLPAL